MDPDQTVLPNAEAQADAGASDQQKPADTPATDTQAEGAKPDGEKPDGEQKQERHPLEKELAKERRRNQAIVRRLHEAETKAREYDALRQREIGATNESEGADSETLSLPKARLNELIEARARELAPTIQNEAAEQERLVSAVNALRSEVGPDQFHELTEDLATIFDEKKQLAVLRTDAPAELIRYLTDPDNADESARIARLDEFDAGRALAKIEAKLEAKKSQAKPQPSKAAAPIEPVRGGGGAIHGSAPTDMKQYMAWAHKQYGR